MKQIYTLALLILITGEHTILARISAERSFIVSPRFDHKDSTTPRVIGLAFSSTGRPIRREPVIVTVDGNDEAVVFSDNRGVWSYSIRPSDILSEGYHVISARSRKSGITVIGTRFIAAMDQKILPPVGPGNVVAARSEIVYPVSVCTNLKQPTIVGVVHNLDNAPVHGETITLSIDGIALGYATSDEHGIFAYTLKDEQKLVDGKHTISAYCGDSSVKLVCVSFLIDTVAPVAPVIALPDPGSMVKENSVLIAGTAEAHAQVMVVIDNAEGGELATADATGEWFITVVLGQGEHSVAASSCDCAGNYGPMSDDVEFMVALRS